MLIAELAGATWCLFRTALTVILKDCTALASPADPESVISVIIVKC